MTQLQPFVDALEKEEYQKIVNKLEDKKPMWVSDYSSGDPYKFREEYVWAVTLALREGCAVSEKVGVNTELIKKVKEKAETLETIMDTK